MAEGSEEGRARFVVRVHHAGRTYPELLRIWRAAEAAGYHGGSLYDLIGAPCLECWTTLTALTVATERLTAIPLVLAHAYRHPAVLSKMAATLTDVSGGRLVLGIGAGGSGSDHRDHGLAYDPAAVRVDQLEEVVQIMRHLWSGQPEALPTSHYGSIIGPGHPIPTPPPPVLIGGHGERYLMRAVARHADICNVGFDLSIDRWEETKALLDRYCIEEGRPPGSVELSHNATVILGDEQAIAARLEEYSQRSGLPVDQVRERLAHAYIGPPEGCQAWLKPYLAAGVSWFFLLFPDLPEVTSLERFAAAVFPDAVVPDSRTPGRELP